MRNTMKRRSIAPKISIAALAAVAVTGFSSAASAHVGFGPHTHLGLGAGLAHPFTGLDHMLAMVAVGLWASQLGRRAMWLLPLTFPAVMAVGAALGLGGLVVPWVETGVASSVLVLGVVIALTLRPSLPISVAVIAAFALLHGYAHGMELPANASALTFGAGFVVSTLTLHLIGIGLGLLAGRIPLRFVAQTAGGAIAAAGAVLLVLH
jgi:urease accessory protein